MMLDKLKLYKSMLRIRFFEEKAMELYNKNLIKGSIHLYIGQEAVAVGVCDNLDIKKGDSITSTHRGHGHLIAMGADLKRMMAELLGKETGLCRGRSGSMHITDITKGAYGANGIVGAGIPIAAGIGFASKYKNEDSVSVTFFGDGASNQGVLYESLNIAAKWDLPVIFLCENNQYAQTTPAFDATSIKSIKEKAKSFGINSEKMDGNDIEEVHQKMEGIISSVRRKKKPYFVEASTYRFRGHWQGDPEVYRSKDEVREWTEKRCPIKNFKKLLFSKYNVDAKLIEDLEKKERENIKQAEEFAIESPEPLERDLLKNIYS